MSGKSISVIAPAYNHEKYIEKCLWSVANQNIDEMELIVIDDVSKDNTRSVIERLIADESFKKHFKLGIRYIPHKENKGAFFSLNQGTSLASGDYITIVNTDDYYGENRLKLLLDACIKNNSEFAFGGIKVVNQDDIPVTEGYGKEIMKYQILIPKCPTVSMALTRGNGTISTGNMIFTRKLYKALDGFGNYKYVHDWDFALRASLLTEPEYVPEAIYYYRYHTSNTISEISQDNRNPDALEKPEGKKTVGVSPLVKFFYAVQHKKYKNASIPADEVWEFFVNHKKYYYDDDTVIWAWNEARRIKL